MPNTSNEKEEPENENRFAHIIIRRHFIISKYQGKSSENISILLVYCILMRIKVF